MTRALCGIALGVIAVASSAWAEASPRVLLWPQHPGVELAAAEREAIAHGVSLVASAALWDQLDAAASALARDDERRFERIQSALDDARRAFLEQRFDDQVEILARLEDEALELLARPEHRELLWDVQFARGLAHLVRGEEGDVARARERFELCAALDADRRPPREIYGPDVAQAFAQARASRGSKAPVPAAIRASPPDAPVTVDGRPILAPRRRVALRPGLHVVRASAPAHKPRATIVRAERGSAIDLALDPAATDDPIARLAAAWQEGELSPASPTGRRALADVARSVGADRVWVIGEDDVRIRSIDARHAEDTGHYADVEAASRALRGEAGLLATDSPVEASTPIYRRWQLWAGASVVAAAVTAAAFTLGRDGSRLRVYAP